MYIIGLILLLFQVVLVARVVLDWSMILAGPAAPGSLRSKLFRVVYAVTEPVLAPVRRVLPPLRLGGVQVDLAFLVVFVVVLILRGLIG